MPVAAFSFYDLLLPGTHDSAAYAARPDLLSRTAPAPMRASVARMLTSRVQSEFAITQNLTVREQLRAGARFLDLRISKQAVTPENVDDFWTVHGMVLCVPLEKVIEQINNFHKAREQARSANWAPVVLAIRTYELSGREKEALGNFLVQTLDGPVFLGGPQELSEFPLQMLPPFILAGVPPAKLSAKWGADVWMDTYIPLRKIQFLSDSLREHEAKSKRGKDKLLVLGWTVTPNAYDVALRVFSMGFMRRTVKEEADDMNCMFEQYAVANAKEIREKANVVFFDCFTAKEASLLRSVSFGENASNG